MRHSCGKTGDMLSLHDRGMAHLGQQVHPERALRRAQEDGRCTNQAGGVDGCAREACACEHRASHAEGGWATRRDQPAGARLGVGGHTLNHCAPGESDACGPRPHRPQPGRRW